MSVSKFVFGTWVLGFVAAGTITAASLSASRDELRTQYIAEYLASFAKDPKSVMNAQPPKFDIHGNRVAARPARFSPQQIADRDFITLKNNWRLRHASNSAAVDIEADAAPARNDQAEDVVTHPESMIHRLDELEFRGLMQGELAKRPWSGDYWPFYKGTLGARYADPAFPKSKDWRANNDYVTQAGRSRDEIFASGNLEAINQLSPAEKYDLLIDVSSSHRGGLTSHMWNQGREYYTTEGEVAEWMGICDGWAPAALMLDRPQSTVTVLAADNATPIQFYPNDIKALASQLWATGSYDYHAQIGSRCDDKHPAMDANGRVRSAECFDVNPATVHLAITHQLGAQRAGLIMDASFDFEVWNQPLRGYRYSYFNPQTLQPVNSLVEAVTYRSGFTNDKFANFRSSSGVAVVGIAMDLTYVAEDEDISADRADDESQDILMTVRYMYDLEIDASGRVIGGEWYTNVHPDFFWRPATTARAISVGDSVATGNWDGKTALPRSWAKGAAHATHEGQPLAKIVETLIELSKPVSPVPTPSTSPLPSR